MAQHSGGVKWTAEQRAGIETTGRSVLVSAAAGSGKTAVLAERCAYLVCDAPQRCDIDELLVVTFTKAAAAEMRARIEQALRKRLAQGDDPRLARQLMLLDRAQISTLHGFCTMLLRQHFPALGLDPNFRVLDEEEVTLLRHEIARDLLDDRHESDGSGEFHRFVDAYGDGNDEIILRRVLDLHHLLGSIVEPDLWLAEQRDAIAHAAAARPLACCALGKGLVKIIRDWLNDLQHRWVQLAGQIERIDGLSAYAEHVNELLAIVMGWQDTFGDGDFDAIASAVNGSPLPRLPVIRKAPAEKEAVQERINAIKDDMRKGAAFDACRFSEQQWRDGLMSILPAVDVLSGLVRDFGERFGRAKRELRGVDFADLEHFALRALRDRGTGSELAPSPIARAYHRQFNHVLVDEYQDINEVQDAILWLVSRECLGTGRSGQQAADSRPSATDDRLAASSAASNLFCVGDVKQSIYRFRLAAPRRFLERYGSFTRQPLAGQVIDLSANFRSRAPLLNVINAVFERLMTAEAVEIEYDESHRLKPGATYPAGDGAACFSGSPVELHLLPAPPRSSGPDEGSDDVQELDRTEREAAFVAARINAMMSGIGGKPMHVADKGPDGSSALRPLRHKDIVILLRSMRYKADQFAGLLRASGIPVHCDSGTGFFESMEVRDMLALLRVLDNQRQDIPLAAVLRSPLSGLPAPDDCLARIRLAYPDAEQTPFHQAAVQYAQEQDDELAAHLKAFFRDLSDWRRRAHERPLAELIWHIYDRTGYLAFCAGMSDGEQRIANLVSFHERARQFGSFQRQGLSRFMAFLESLAEQSDLGQPSISSEADDVVRVMSIHRSKGLEFLIVFVPDLGKRHNLQDTSGPILVDRDAGIGLMVTDEIRRVRYPSLAHVLVQERIRRQTLAEELRVLYVAMTRAREHLILVGACDESAMQKWKEQWARHCGPLPAERVLGSQTMLDWIGPAAAMIEASGTPDRIEMTWHGEAEVAGWSTVAARRPALSEEQMRLARLEPLDPPPPPDPAAAAVRDRLTRRYPHRAFADLPAAQSVGSLTKEGRLAPGGQSVSASTVVSFDAELPAPKCVLEERTAAPTEIGSATHLVLEHLDFRRPCDRQDLREQVADLVRKRLITPALAEVVDLDAIVWLVATPLGRLLRNNASMLRRELPVYFPQALDGVPPSTDPRDRIMVRGRVDVLIPDPAGIVLADYKTDQVNERTVQARADFYRPQLSSYRDALAAILGQPVKSAQLVFLSVRMIQEL